LFQKKGGKNGRRIAFKLDRLEKRQLDVTKSPPDFILVIGALSAFGEKRTIKAVLRR